MADSVLSKHSDSDSDSGDSQLLTRKKGTQHALTTMSQLGQKVNTRCIIQTAFIQRMQWNHAATKNGFGSTTDFIQLGPCFGQWIHSRWMRLRVVYGSLWFLSGRARIPECKSVLLVTTCWHWQQPIKSSKREETKVFDSYNNVSDMLSRNEINNKASLGAPKNWSSMDSVWQIWHHLSSFGSCNPMQHWHCPLDICHYGQEAKLWHSIFSGLLVVSKLLLWTLTTQAYVQPAWSRLDSSLLMQLWQFTSCNLCPSPS